MRRHGIARQIGGMGLCLCLSLGIADRTGAQTFSSGSTGALGAFAPTSNTMISLPPDGFLNYTTVTIPSGVTVTFTPNAANTPVTILATGDVTIAGTLSVDGTAGIPGVTSGPLFPTGSPGGPGGFRGGNGTARGDSNPYDAGEGQGPGWGCAAGHPNCGREEDASYGTGTPSPFVSLLPLFGGSGGAGSYNGGTQSSGASGGGGGGAIVLASSTQITVTGSLTADGEARASAPAAGTVSGSGSGGAIRLVAPTISWTGTLSAQGGAPFGGAGLIRVEAFSLTFTGTSTPAASFTPAPGPVTAASTPALGSPPTLTISAVASIAAPSAPTGSFTAADVALPTGTINPVTVTLTAANIPVGTTLTVRVVPQFGFSSTVTSTATTGTFGNATATASVTLPVGQVSVLNAYGSFTLPQLARLFPPIDGEPVERVQVATTLDGPSTVTLVTKSGKMRHVDEVLPSWNTAKP